jgi:hypothetical protein
VALVEESVSDSGAFLLGAFIGVVLTCGAIFFLSLLPRKKE